MLSRTNVSQTPASTQAWQFGYQDATAGKSLAEGYLMYIGHQLRQYLSGYQAAQTLLQST